MTACQWTYGGQVGSLSALGDRVFMQNSFSSNLIWSVQHRLEAEPDIIGLFKAVLLRELH